MNVLALCAGIAGLELGVKLACHESRTVCYVEHDAAAVAVLKARIASRDIDDAPIWDDVRTFHGLSWRGCVDLITAGYPCQPESTAGLQLGQDDERWLWADVWRVIRDVGPRYVFVENVAAHLSGTWDRVVGDMAACGWRVEWDCIPAAAVGAPHLRDRVFALAASPVAHRSIAHTNPGRWSQQVIGSQRQDQARVANDGTACRTTEPRRLFEPERAPQPGVLRVADGFPTGLELRLNLLGNAVVPQAAALAFSVLWERMHS